jgi:two-component system, OmpR family, sensor histidine kinase BaeS
LISGGDVKLKIQHKLFFTLLFTSTVVATGLFLFLQWNFDRGFLNYVNNKELNQLDQLADRLTGYYAEQNDWHFMAGNDPLWRRIHEELFSSFPVGGHPPPRVGREHRSPPPRDSQGIGPRIILYDKDKQWLIGGPSGYKGNLSLRPVIYQKNTVGYLGLIPVTEISYSGDLLFVEQQTETFGLVTLVMVAVSMLLTFPLTYHLLRPIKELSTGTRKLIGGQFKTRIPVSTGDELGQLSADFNILAMTLEKNEKARQQWVADISHELRTPLSVLRGEVEALQDGIRKPGPQALDPIHYEIMHLDRLVNDLYELTMSDIGALTYKKIEVNPVGILEDTLDLFENRFTDKGLVLNTAIPANSPHFLLADPDRLQQLFTNILENSLRYTDTPGRLDVYVMSEKESVTISFQDSTPGVDVSQLPKLFDRLFRVDPSRNRAKKGAGLGLAICKNIVEAHQGTITAHNSPHGGIVFKINFPLSS